MKHQTESPWLLSAFLNRENKGVFCMAWGKHKASKRQGGKRSDARAPLKLLIDWKGGKGEMETVFSVLLMRP